MNHILISCEQKQFNIMFTIKGWYFFSVSLSLDHLIDVSDINVYFLRSVILFVYLLLFFSSHLITDETVRYLVECGRRLVLPMQSVWYTVCQKSYCDWHDYLLTILYQVIPSLIMDLFISNPKRKLTPFVRKMLVMADVIKFFIHNQFEFANDNLFNVINR